MKNVKSVIIDGVEYVPKKKKSDTQGYTDEELIMRSMFEADEYRKSEKREGPEFGAW